MTTAESDLQYIRQLAETGAAAPLLGGRFLTWFGALVTLAYAGHYLALQGVAGMTTDAIGWIWGAFLVIAPLGYVLLGRLMPRDKPGRGSAGNRLEPVVWMLAGMSIFAFFVGLLLGHAMRGEPPVHPDMSLPLVFAVYSLSLGTTGTLARNTMLQTASWIGLGFVGITTALVGHPGLYLAGAIGVALTVLLPGILLLRNEPAAAS